LDQATAYAPGSASNLGPGFDCLGVAFTGKGDAVTVVRVAASGVRVASVSEPRIPLDAARNTAAIAARAVWRRARASGGLELAIEKGLPLAAGMGGSAASAVAGAFAANALLERPLRREDLLDCALEGEAVVAGRHPDNVAPSLFGGAVLVTSLDPLRVVLVRVHSELALVLATPDYEVETARARAVLPAAIERSEAIGQAARLGALVLALERGDGDLLGMAMRDAIAEPARAALYPGAAEARAQALRAGAHGVCVSGAGPTLLALAWFARASAVAEALVAGYQRAGIAAVPHVAAVDPQGARLVP
jgi:homoserine kinase